MPFISPLVVRWPWLGIAVLGYPGFSQQRVRWKAAFHGLIAVVVQWTGYQCPFWHADARDSDQTCIQLGTEFSTLELRLEHHGTFSGESLYLVELPSRTSVEGYFP